MTRTDLRVALVTLALGAAGAGLFWLVGFPAAVLTGPAAMVSLASILGVRVAIPTLLRDGCFLVLGLSIGSTITPEVLATARAWPASLVVLALALVATLFAVRFVLQRVYRFDRMTALLASTPGHLSYVLGLSADLQADVARVALVQSVRVLLLTLAVPLIIALWGAEGTTRAPGYGLLPGPILALLLVLSLGLGLVFRRLHVPAALLLGAIVVSGVGHGSDLTPGTVPPWLTGLAFVIMGSLIGTRFNGISGREVLGALSAGVVATVIACLLATIAALLAAQLIDLPPAALLLAFAPGGVEVMAALAVETGLEPAFVAAHHVFRLLILTALLPAFLAIERRRH